MKKWNGKPDVLLCGAASEAALIIGGYRVGTIHQGGFEYAPHLHVLILGGCVCKERVGNEVAYRRSLNRGVIWEFVAKTRFYRYLRSELQRAVHLE